MLMEKQECGFLGNKMMVVSTFRHALGWCLWVFLLTFDSTPTSSFSFA